MNDDEFEYREPANATEAFLDCARYNDSGDAKMLCNFLTSTPSLIDARDEQGRTAVHMAAANNHIDVVEMLMEFGPQPDVPNFEGNTALHFAAMNNQLIAAQILLEKGWRASTKNADGKTPIQLIYNKGFNEMETLLLERDASLECYDAHVVAPVTESAASTSTALVGAKQTIAQESTAAAPSGSGSGASEEIVKAEKTCEEKDTAPGESGNKNSDPRLGSADVDNVE